MSAHPEPTPVENARAAVDAARFPLVAEGYDPHSVDVLLDRLATLLADHVDAVEPSSGAAPSDVATQEADPDAAAGPRSPDDEHADVDERADVDESVPDDRGSDRASGPPDALRAPRRLTDDDLAFLASLRASVDRPGDDGGAPGADPRR